MFNLRTQRLRGDALLLDEFVPGTTFEVGAQELVGHVPVPEEERRVGEEPLLELQAVVAVIENRIIGKDKPMGFDRELVGPERQRRRANHFKRGIPDDIGQLRREAGRLAWVFAEFQTAGRGKVGHIIGVRNLTLGNGRPLRQSLAGSTCQDQEAEAEQEADGVGPCRPLWLTE